MTHSSPLYSVGPSFERSIVYEGELNDFLNKSGIKIRAVTQTKKNGMGMEHMKHYTAIYREGVLFLYSFYSSRFHWGGGGGQFLILIILLFLLSCFVNKVLQPIDHMVAAV